MSFEMKEGSGSLFKNDRKEGDTDRDYQGSIKIDGREYWLNAWIKQGKTGIKYMSLSAKAKDAPKRTQQARTPEPERDEFDDDIKF